MLIYSSHGWYYFHFFMWSVNKVDSYSGGLGITNMLQMPSSSDFKFPFSLWLLILFSLSVAHLLSQYFQNGLHKYRGPFLASFTDLWRLHHAYKSRRKEPMIHIHEKYGDIVRMGPNTLSFSQPQAIKDIYGSAKQFKKVNLI